MAWSVLVMYATGSTLLSLHVATIDASSAQFSAPISFPANNAFLRVRATGLMAFSTELVSSSRRPSSKNRVRPAQWLRA